ncbi:TIGR01212 family radical SAM protein [Bacteroides sp. 214]|uniref:TIGR01212 family radical SAM protein n=1 Tax=Bacteroides sp. 214 TaxID=2302935 RepID=UPI0013CF63CB|nr:TIGR01212 family radical SAM protein [Bacteroides sp. 214]NDW11657.1 TIGR01212 family radical SAM protein [Bacteroides sp. 214]
MRTPTYIKNSSTPLYNEFASFMKEHFTYKVQKISINAGFTCPNRDGNKGLGGCTYCNNQTFNPDYCRTEKSITQQLEEGKEFFAHKYPEMKYLAYFQAYTNTYDELETLKQKYQEALAVKDVVGLVIGTRPDCMPDSLLDYFETLNNKHFILIEYGIESCLEKTLKRINRGHTFADVKDAINRTASRGILTGGHVILGLPGESKEEIIAQASILSKLPINTLKLHQLQIIRGTHMELEYRRDEQDFQLFNIDDYIDVVVAYIRRLRSDIVVERFVSQSPKELLIAPDWGIKNHEFAARVKKKMKEIGAHQGDSNK